MLTRSAKFFFSVCKHVQPKRVNPPAARPFKLGEVIPHARPRGFFSVQRPPARTQMRTITYSTSPMTATPPTQAVVGACDFPRTAVVGFCGIPFSRQFSTARSPWQVPPSPQLQRQSSPQRHFRTSHVLANLPSCTTYPQTDSCVAATVAPATDIETQAHAPALARFHTESRGFGDLIEPSPGGRGGAVPVTAATRQGTGGPARRVSLPIMSSTSSRRTDASHSGTDPTVEQRRGFVASRPRQALDPTHRPLQQSVCLLMDLYVGCDVAPDQTTARLDASFLQSVTLLADRSRDHFTKMLTLLKRLLPQQAHGRRFQVTQDGSQLCLFFPPTLFLPHEPSKEQARRWLAGIGVDPDDPALQLIDTDTMPNDDPQSCRDTASNDIVGPGYFQGIQSFLDHVDTLIENSTAFGARRHPG